MDDRRLAEALQAVAAVEADVLTYLGQLRPTDLAERDQATVVFRQARALRKPLATWVAVRTLRTLTTQA